MFRLAAFAITLTVATGPSLGLLCTTWCNPEVAAASGCHHTVTGPTVAASAGSECDDAIGGVAALLPRDAQRGMSTPDRDHGILVPRDQLASRTLDRLALPSVTSEWPLRPRSLSTILRI